MTLSSPSPLPSYLKPRHRVLVEVDPAPSAPRQAANDDIFATTFATRRLYGNTGNASEQIGDAMRRRVRDALLINRRNGIGSIEFRLPRRRAGHYDFICTRGARVIGCLLVRAGCAAFGRTLCPSGRNR